MEQRSFLKEIREFKFDLSWGNLRDYLFILVGVLIQALSMRMFLIPAQLVSGGVSGLAQIVDYFVKLPIGLMIIIGNIPLFIIGWKYLGTVRFALRTGIATFAFAVFTDLVGLVIPPDGVTHDLILQALYGGILYGLGLGFVYRGKGTSGGSDIICRILNHYLGIPITQAYLIVDAVVVLGGGFVFGWDIALYGIVVIYISGLGAEMIAEGNSSFRTAMIISCKPQEVTQIILEKMERGVTIINAKGGYTNEERPLLYCALTRSEIPSLKEIVHHCDPEAFMVIGQANEALGEGFNPFEIHRTS
ncbi:MAG: YitT family protein [Anaerolineaceae bacterium]|nr:YitT family protein [Anaerolineaceae bacterium]